MPGVVPTSLSTPASLPGVSVVAGRATRCGGRLGRMAHSRRKGDRSHGVDGSGALGPRLGGGESLEKSLCGGCVTVEHRNHGRNLIWGRIETGWEVACRTIVVSVATLGTVNPYVSAVRQIDQPVNLHNGTTLSARVSGIDSAECSSSFRDNITKALLYIPDPCRS